MAYAAIKGFLDRIREQVHDKDSIFEVSEIERILNLPNLNISTYADALCRTFSLAVYLPDICNLLPHLTYGGDCFTEDANILVCMGDYFETAQALDEPGMDILGIPDAWHIKDKVMRRGPKFPSSLAHGEGKSRCLAEGPGLLGWSATLEELKAATDFVYAYGVNKVIPNAFFYTISHEHYYETPSYFYQWPLWRYYDTYDRYVARLGYLLTRGIHVAPVALFFPTDTYLKNYNPLSPNSRESYGSALGKENPEMAFVSESFSTIADSLLREQIDFDYMYNRCFLKATVENKQLKSGEELYRILIVPPTTALSSEVVHKLQDLAKAGVKILFVGPTEVQIAETGEKVSLATLIKNAIFLPLSPDISDQTLRDQLCTLLREIIDCDVEITASPTKDYFAHNHRRVDDLDVYFLINLSIAQQTACIKLSSIGDMEVWDPVTGKRTPLRHQVKAGKTIFSHSFAPRESLVVVINRREMPKVGDRTLEKQISLLPDEWQFKILDDNMYLPSSLNCSSEWKERQSWMGTSLYRYRFSLPIAEIPDRLLLLMDYVQPYKQAGSLKVFVNGNPVDIKENDSLDQEFLECSLDKSVQIGSNEVLVEYEHTDYMVPINSRDLQNKQTMPPPTPKMRVMGNFKIAEGKLAKATPEKISTGSWTEFGYPYYSGTALYQQTFLLPIGWVDGAGEIVLKFESLAEVAQIKINGKDAGIVPWRPWELRTEGFFVSGENHIEIKVTNTQSNQMYEQAKASGILGNVWLEK